MNFERKERQDFGALPEHAVLKRRPVAWLVSSLCVFLAFPASEAVNAQMLGQGSVLDRGPSASTPAPAPQQTNGAITLGKQEANIQSRADQTLASTAAIELKPLSAEGNRVAPSVSRTPPATFSQWLETQPVDADGRSPVDSATLRGILLNAVQDAEQRSPELAQAYADYEASKADVDEAKGQRWPQIDVGSQTQGLQFGPGNRNPAYNNGNVVTMNVTTTLYDWGRTKNTIGSRAQLAEASRSKYEAARDQNAHNVTSTLVELGKQRAIVDLSQQFVDRMGTLVKMLEEIVAVDRGRGSELTQARARLMQAEASRDAAQAKVRDAELTLRKLVGDEAPLIPRTNKWAIQPAELSPLLSRVDGHPSLLQIRAEADAADLNAKVVKASGRPSINWVVSANAGMGGAEQRTPWQTMLTLNWAAFRGGSTRAAAAAAGHRAQSVWQRLDQQRRDLEFGIRAADQDARTMLSRADLYQGLSAETDKVRKAFFEQWYHLGKRTLLDVLIAENDHYGNSVSEVTNRFDGYAAVMRGYASAGALIDWLSTGHSG